jgi:hypothetical protein
MIGRGRSFTKPTRGESPAPKQKHINIIEEKDSVEMEVMRQLEY